MKRTNGKGNGKQPSTPRVSEPEIADSDDVTSRPPVGKGGRVAEHVVELRLRQVQSMMTQGHRTGMIYRLVAKSQRKEMKARELARKQGKAIEDYPALVWGHTVPADRTIDDYIARVKERFEAEGRSLSKQGAVVFGQANAMIADLYTPISTRGRCRRIAMRSANA
jgi:hypothetical protein